MTTSSGAAPGRDGIAPGQGDDIVHGGGGGDSIIDIEPDGSSGGLTLSVRGANTYYGGRGDDWMGGGRGPDLLNAGPGHDIVLGYQSDDLLRGGRGRDTAGGGREHLADRCVHTEIRRKCELVGRSG